MQSRLNVLRLFDNEKKAADVEADSDALDWFRVWPFIGLHLGCLAVIWVGWSPVAVAIACASYFLRMFAITAFYHRYFSHRSFKTGRITQFLFGMLGVTATQRGPLWWTAHHRQHHRSADTESDPHSPRHGFWRSHAGWFLGGRHFNAPMQLVRDLSRYPELRWLDRFDLIVPILFAVSLWLLGLALEHLAPSLNTSSWQILVWGYFISTVALTHVTLSINSLAHRWGTRRYATQDDSRNNMLLALLTLGEGWHNNHHHHAGSVRQGFFWWELDISYYILRVLAACGLIWDLRTVPEAKRWAHRTSPTAGTTRGEPL